MDSGYTATAPVARGVDVGRTVMGGNSSGGEMEICPWALGTKAVSSVRTIRVAMEDAEMRAKRQLAQNR